MEERKSKENPFVVEFGRGALDAEKASRTPNTENAAPSTENEEKTRESGNQTEINYVPGGDISEEGGAKGVYTKLEASIVQFELEGFEKSGIQGDAGISKMSMDYFYVDSIYETLLVLLNSSFILFSSLGIAYWHEVQGRTREAYATLLILAIGAVLVHLSYAFHREIKKANIWDTNKLFAILTLIPGTLTTVLSLADVIFAVKENREPGFRRPWKGTALVYLVESLALAFPQCVLQGIYLMEESDSIPKIKGLFVLFTLGCLTMGIALARIRYDSARRPDRFGTGMDKIIRSSIVWGNKGLWVTTFTLVVVTARLYHGGENNYVLASLLAVFVIYEVPVIFSSIPAFRFCLDKLSGMFFVLPQFLSLTVLIMWVNADETVYLTNIGVCAMGAFSWFESLTLIGWLLDGCNDRDMDILPIYPHFFGDLYTSSCCRKSGRN